VKTAKLAYPKNVGEFRKRFATEESCIQYLIQCRWSDGFICSQCKGDRYWYRPKRKLLVCQTCRKEISPTAGTLMHRSHLPIQEWFWAAYLVATITPGISATQLQRQLGVGCYQTAWFILKRLRRGMVNECRTPLTGLIEADETFVGGPVKGKKGRGVAKEDNVALVIGAVEIATYIDKKGAKKERAKRLRLQHINQASEKTIHLFLDNNVSKGSLIRTDGWRGYSKTALKNYGHDKRIIGDKPAHQLAPHIHRVFSNLKTWLQGTHHGVHPKYMQEYLDEYVFRFNRRQTPMAAFQTLLGITTSKKPKTLRQIMGVK